MLYVVEIIYLDLLLSWCNFFMEEIITMNAKLPDTPPPLPQGQNPLTLQHKIKDNQIL